MSADRPDRAAALWRRLSGMFGPDAIARKFGATPPPEWAAMIARLNDFELERGVRRLVYSGRAHVPTLPEFLRLCRAVEDEADHTGPKAQLTALPAEAPVSKWQVLGNQHLLAHVLRQAAKRRYYACAETGSGRHPLVVAGASVATTSASDDLTAPLVQAKNTWALMMEDAAAEGTLPADHGRAWWAEMMANADAVVDDVRARHARRSAA